MILALVAANVIGCLLLAVATLKRLDSAERVTGLDRLAMLCLVFLALAAAIDTLASHSVPSPPQAGLVLVWGLFSVWHAFGPLGESFHRAIGRWLGSRNTPSA